MFGKAQNKKTPAILSPERIELIRGRLMRDFHEARLGVAIAAQEYNNALTHIHRRFDELATFLHETIWAQIDEHSNGAFFPETKKGALTEEAREHIGRREALMNKYMRATDDMKRERTRFASLARHKYFLNMRNRAGDLLSDVTDLRDEALIGFNDGRVSQEAKDLYDNAAQVVDCVVSRLIVESLDAPTQTVLMHTDAQTDLVQATLEWRLTNVLSGGGISSHRIVTDLKGKNALKTSGQDAALLRSLFMPEQHPRYSAYERYPLPAAPAAPSA